MTQKESKISMSTKYYSELDQSEFLNEKHLAIFRPIIGSLNLLITLGRWGIYYKTNTLSRYGISPRVGQMQVAFRVLCYLRKYPDGKTLFDTKFHK